MYVLIPGIGRRRLVGFPLEGSSEGPSRGLIIQCVKGTRQQERVQQRRRAKRGEHALGKTQRPNVVARLIHSQVRAMVVNGKKSQL